MVCTCPTTLPTASNPYFPSTLLKPHTYFAHVLTKPLSTPELIVIRAIQLQKRPQDLETVKSKVIKAHFNSIHKFNEMYSNLIRDSNFSPGTLVLFRNFCYDTDVGSKIKPRYFGPTVVLRRTQGGPYTKTIKWLAPT